MRKGEEGKKYFFLKKVAVIYFLIFWRENK